MSLFSLEFLVFMGILLIFFYKVKPAHQWIVLLIFSYGFYMFNGGYKVVIYMIITTITTYLGGIGIENMLNGYKNYIAENKPNLTREEAKAIKQKNLVKRRWLLTLIMLINFGILGYLKYSGFVLNQFARMFTAFNMDFNYTLPNLLLPLGISFYTFQSMGYLIDVHRGTCKADRNIFKFALFVSFFPQIIQGPISRYSQLAPQLEGEHPFVNRNLKFGAQRILWGYFKKLVIAERAGVIVNAVFDNYTGYSGFTIFFAVFVYAFQIYADFSGGIDIVLGAAEMLGIKMEENFKQPFMATSIAQYWQRWHITLGTWMRDYVFYTLALSKGFNRMSKWFRKHFGSELGKVIPAVVASFVVFFLVGVWHGASWKFIFYGVYNAIFVSSGTLLEKPYYNMKHKLRINEECISWKVFQVVRTLFIVTMGRYFTRATSFTMAIEMCKRTFSEFNPWVLFDESFFYLGDIGRESFQILFVAIVVLMIVDLLHEKGISIRTWLEKQDVIFRWFVNIAAIFSIVIYGQYGVGLVARLIYQGF